MAAPRDEKPVAFARDYGAPERTDVKVNGEKEENVEPRVRPAVPGRQAPASPDLNVGV
jgi:hypothetical protein